MFVAYAIPFVIVAAAIVYFIRSRKSDAGTVIPGNGPTVPKPDPGDTATSGGVNPPKEIR